MVSNIALNSPVEGEHVSCSYDLVFKWDQSSATNFTDGYTNLTGGTNDTTSGVGSSDNKYYPSKYYVRTGYDKDGKNNTYAELNELTISISSVTYTGNDVDGRGQSSEDVQEKNIDEFKLGGSGDSITLLSHEIGTDKTKGAHIDYTIEFKFYNLDKDQSHLMGKNFKGKVSVENVEC